MFQGFSEDTIKFFLDIRFNNNSIFFDNNIERYKQVRQEFCLLIDSLADYMLQIDNEIDVRPYKALARIRRDTRFYKQQEPYRDHMWFIFKKPSETRLGSPFFWFELTVEKAVVGAGIWGEYKPFYDILRHEILNTQSALLPIIDRLNNNNYNLHGEIYKRIKIPTHINNSLHKLYSAKSLYFSKSIIPYSLVFDSKLQKYLINEYNNLSEYYNYCKYIVNKINSNKI